MSNTSDICIIGLKCYDLLAGTPVPRYLGGIEKQLVSLARGLADNGRRVSFITYDHGQPDGVNCNGITLYTAYPPDSGIPGIRFFHPRMTLLWSAMKRANASIYIQMGAGNETGVTALGCRRTKNCRGARKFVFLVASDSDCEQELPKLPPVREKMLYKFGLRSASAVFSQTMQQHAMLLKAFGRDSEVIPLPCTWAIPEKDYVPKKFPGPDSVHILWVGRIIEIKRLEWFIDAAECCPNFHFDVVGTPNVDSEYFKALKIRMAGMGNLTMHGRVSDAVLRDLYLRAGLLCCTSIIEGFPTTFLEAWNYGLPVVTTFDPDNIVRKNGIGCVVDSVEHLVATIQNLLSTPERWNTLASASRKFFTKNYTSDALIPRFEEIFSRLA